eukprot:TRINITY_DN2958_c0_g1_i1.p1 TRINITY_DN2958_c0_g1~~TRINITY_DN2958_c0_g1_i1.p1  ORF type:complete len:234 (-),score=18.14 TRINITY_DN2958_c0_g1_i1:3-704(-)
MACFRCSEDMSTDNSCSFLCKSGGECERMETCHFFHDVQVGDMVVIHVRTKEDCFDARHGETPEEYRNEDRPSRNRYAAVIVSVTDDWRNNDVLEFFPPLPRGKVAFAARNMHYIVVNLLSQVYPTGAKLPVEVGQYLCVRRNIISTIGFADAEHVAIAEFKTFKINMICANYLGFFRYLPKDHARVQLIKMVENQRLCDGEALAGLNRLKILDFIWKIDDEYHMQSPLQAAD